MRSFLCLVVITALGCTADPTATGDRDEARRLGGGADLGRDLCEEYGFYDDGAWCDEFCPMPDPDCARACASDADCLPTFCAGDDCAATICAAGQCAVDAPCEAELEWLQKDAYKSEAGRTADFWPPHTTMVLRVRCGGAVVREEVAANHGTLPDAVDAEGTPILVSVHEATTAGTRSELEALADAFAGCECGTTFLSLDALEETVVNDLVGQLATYLNANLTCAELEGGTEALVDALVAGDVAFVLANGAACTWAGGASWEEGFDEALAAVAEATSETLADYHVCNNDAALQADLFDRFAAGERAATCDAASALCRSPRWFYAPAP